MAQQNNSKDSHIVPVSNFLLVLSSQQPGVLQSSLIDSMKYLYDDSEVAPKGARNIFDWFFM